MFFDKTLTCRMCGNPFVFSADEQAFFAEKGFSRAPDYCRDCRIARRRQAYQDALNDPGKRFHYRCNACGRVFVTIRPIANPQSPIVRCPACVPVGMPPYTDDDRNLNAALGFPRHLD